jgi:hypothetical protein
VNSTTRQKWLRRKRRIAKRLRPRKFAQRARPMLAGGNIQYQLAERTRAIAHGGIGSIHLLARKVGLIDAIDRELHVLKVHLPYHESDHVLNIAYNILCDGHCLEDLERLRNDEAYLDALGASRIPDPTTAGDFCRRFESPEMVRTLMEAINTVRLGDKIKQGQQNQTGKIKQGQPLFTACRLSICSDNTAHSLALALESQNNFRIVHLGRLLARGMQRPGWAPSACAGTVAQWG